MFFATTVKAEPVLRIEAADTHSSWRVTCAAFINLNKQIVAAYETGHIRVFDTAVCCSAACILTLVV